MSVLELGAVGEVRSLRFCIVPGAPSAVCSNPGSKTRDFLQWAYETIKGTSPLGEKLCHSTSVLRDRRRLWTAHLSVTAKPEILTV